MRSRLAMLSLLVLLQYPGSAVAHDASAPAHVQPGHVQRDFRQLASQIAGGATLLVDVASTPAISAFHERAHHFEESLEQGGAHVASDWRELRTAFGPARSSAGRRDSRVTFLVTHLDKDLAEGDRLVGSYASAPAPAPGGAGTSRLSFIDHEVCVGNQDGRNSCPTSRQSLTFSIPRNVAVINRLDGEWRDFGRGADAEIYVNDRLVWRADVAKDWDGDGKSLDVRIPPGSTLTVRSSNGDAIWIRSLSAQTLAATDSGQTYMNPWDFLWPNRN